MENMFEKLANQEPLRNELMIHMRKYPRSLNKVAKDMRISPITLGKFLRDKTTVAWVTLCRIDDYIIAKKIEAQAREVEIAQSILKGIAQ